MFDLPGDGGVSCPERTRTATWSQETRIVVDDVAPRRGGYPPM